MRIPPNRASPILPNICCSKDRKRTARRISEEIDALGGSLNAYTTRQYTRFYAQVLSANPCPAEPGRCWTSCSICCSIPFRPPMISGWSGRDPR